MNNENDLIVRWECAHNCGRGICDEFYQKIIRDAGHAPRCICRYGLSKNPWSAWKKINCVTNETIDVVSDE